MVETGIFDPSAVTWPDGNVRLLAASTPVTCATLMPFRLSDSGSRVISTRWISPPVTSTLPTPSSASSAGSISDR